MARSARSHGSVFRWLLSSCAAGALALVATFGIQAQEQFELVITATDQAGMPVLDLKPSDVTMAENGMPGKVVAFERLNRPVKLTLIMDNGPDSERLLEFYRTGLTALTDALPAEVEVTMYTTAGSPREAVKPTLDRGVLKKAFARLGRDSDDARFTDSLMEYSQRLDKDAKAKKLVYTPALIMVSAIGNDPSSYGGLAEVDKAIGVVANAGARVSVAVTTSKLNDSTARQDLTIGRQGIIGAKVSKLTRGDFQALPDPKALSTVLPEWGKQIADLHTKSTTTYRLVLQRPAGVTGEIKDLDLRITRPGVKAALAR